MEDINLIIIIVAILALLVVLMIKKRRDDDYDNTKCDTSSCDYTNKCSSYCQCPKLDCSECRVCPVDTMPSSGNKYAFRAAGTGRWVMDQTTCQCNAVCGKGTSTCGAKCSTGNPKDCVGSPPKFTGGSCDSNVPCKWYFNQDPKCPDPKTYAGPLKFTNMAQCPSQGQCKDPKPADRVINCPVGTGYINWYVGPTSGPCISNDGGCSGYRTRTVYCPRPGYCKGEKPLEKVPCTDNKCQWVYGEWGPWQRISGESDDCGNFVSQRQVKGCTQYNLDGSWCKNTPQVTRQSKAVTNGCHWKVSGVGSCDKKSGIAPLYYNCPYGTSDEPCRKNDGNKPTGYTKC